MLKILLTVLSIYVLSCQGQSLLEFHENFANQSVLAQAEINSFSQQNRLVRLQLIRWIVQEIANLTVDMRRITEDTKVAIEAHELLNDDCRPSVQYSFDFYVQIGALDIMYCAYDMDFYLRFDAEHRFVPKERFINRESFRVLSQTVHTLGGTTFVNHLDSVFEELDYEAVRYEKLWNKYQVELAQEIKDINLLEEIVRSEMDWWFTYAIYWHTLLMQQAIDLVETYCKVES